MILFFECLIAIEEMLQLKMYIHIFDIIHRFELLQQKGKLRRSATLLQIISTWIFKGLVYDMLLKYMGIKIYRQKHLNIQSIYR